MSEEIVNQIFERFIRVLIILLVVMVFFTAFLFIGIVVGYVIVGDGQFMDIFTGHFWELVTRYFVS